MSDTTGKYDSLHTLGLTDLEAQIYLFLAEGQPQTALRLSRGLAIPRTSVYDTLTRLGEKGLVERVIKSKSTLYKASPATVFQSLIRAQKEKTIAMSASLVKLEKQLETAATLSSNTEVRYYQGPEGMRQMIWNCLRAKDELVGYSVFGRVEVVGKPFYKRFVDEFHDRGLEDRVIANPTKRTLDYIHKDVKPYEHQLSLQNIRVLPESKLFISGDIMIYNNIYALSYWMSGEVIGVEIENSDFIRHERSIFELLWPLAEPISTNKNI